MIPLRTLLFCVLGILPSVAASADEGLLPIGEHRSRGGDCEVRILTSAEGGGRDLSIVRPKSALVAQDVTGAIWRDSMTLVYSVSPIYGRPGIFELDCQSGHHRTVVPPVTKNKGYPDGADYFELVSVDPKMQQACFYYSPDVDRADFSSLRTPKHIRCVQLQ